jgi:prevent-host-death family protein
MLQSKIMEVPITQFRLRLFDLVNQAREGKDVWVSHKGRRVRIVPEHAASKLSRITPMQILIPEDFDMNDPAFKAKMLAEMEKEWQRDWERDFGPAPKQAQHPRPHLHKNGKKVTKL